jgi:hypothetical protein
LKQGAKQDLSMQGRERLAELTVALPEIKFEVKPRPRIAFSAQDMSP